MNFRSFWNEDNLLWEALLLSLGLHFLLFHAGDVTLRFHEKHTVEIDITNMGHMGVSGGNRRAAAPPAPKPVARPKEWVKPAPNQKVIPASVPTTPVPASPPEEEAAPPLAGPPGNGTGEYGIGTGDGSESVLSRIPQLLNLSDLGAILNRFYPEQARAQRQEGVVVLDLHIDADGHIKSVDVIQSGGADFDEAARRVAKLLRFTPAFMGSQRVAVKLRQAIQFKLKN